MSAVRVFHIIQLFSQMTKILLLWGFFKVSVFVFDFYYSIIVSIFSEKELSTKIVDI